MIFQQKGMEIPLILDFFFHYPLFVSQYKCTSYCSTHEILPEIRISVYSIGGTNWSKQGITSRVQAQMLS